MWEPQQGWHPLPGGTGASTVGLWRAAQGGRPVVIKRLAAPTPGDPAELSEPGHAAYWRREADVLGTGLTAGTPGLRAVPAAIEEDDQGITVTREWVEDAALSGLFVAMALGRFAGCDLPRPRFLARHQLGDRMARVERRGGWQTLARTTVADVAQHLWERRTTMLDLVEALPQVPQHGDPTPMNLPGRDGDEVLAIDWGTLGTGPVGGDLGYYSLGSREAFEPLLDAYLMGLPAEPRLARRRTPGGAGDRRLHRAQPGRVGVGAGGRRRGCSGRQVPAPVRGSAPAGPAAAVSPDRGTARLVGLRPGRRRTCHTPAGCPPCSRSRTTSSASPPSRGSRTPR